jgi:hypothetical protein
LKLHEIARDFQGISQIEMLSYAKMGLSVIVGIK